MNGTRMAVAIEPALDERYRIVQQEVDIGVSALRENDPLMAITLFQSALQKISINDPFHDHLVHNLLSSYKCLIENSLRIGDFSAVDAHIRAALRLEILGEMQNSLDFRARFAAIFQDIAVTLYKNRRFSDSVSFCRKAIFVDSGVGSQVNLVNALVASRQRAVLSDFTSDINSSQLGRHLFIACVPKSGSTFLKNALLYLTGYRDAFMVNTPSQFEQDLYLPTLLRTAKRNTVTQQHCRASDINVFIMQAFEIRPVVLVRNVFDAVVSLLDFYNGGAYANSYFREDYSGLDPQTKVDLIIDNFVPWYFQFVVSWEMAQKQERLDMCWLNYEDMIADKTGTVLKILNFYGLTASEKDINETITRIESQKEKTRFNRGVSGRGAEGLSRYDKDRITNHAKYYPSADLTRLGL